MNPYSVACSCEDRLTSLCSDCRLKLKKQEDVPYWEPPAAIDGHARPLLAA